MISGARCNRAGNTPMTRMNPDTLPLLLTPLAQADMEAPAPTPVELTNLTAGPYELPATFACVMLLATLVLIVFMKPGSMPRIFAGIPFSLFILTLVAIPLEAATGFQLLDFTLAEPPSPTLSTLRLAAELLCYAAAWKCVPWLYVGKDALIAGVVRLLTHR